MRLPVFKSVILFLAFGIGVIFTSLMSPNLPNTAQLAEETATNPTTTASPQINEPLLFKYGCREEKLVSFWEKLDKEEFSRHQKAFLKNLHKGYPQLFRDSWNDFRQNFDCSFFGRFSRDDLNGDGIAEWRVSRYEGMRDFSEYVFREKASSFQMILFDSGSIESEILPTSSYGFRDLVYMSNWSGGGRSISQYKFNGKVYVATKCFDEDTMVRRHGEMIQVDRSVIKLVPCAPHNKIKQ